LRIRIEISLTPTGAAQLHAVPWEYLACDGHFLCLSLDISIVRYPILRLPNDRPPVPAPLSILVLPGEVSSAAKLDLAGEQRELERAWSESGNVRIHVLPERTLDALREELRERQYHVLHFMGHGGFSAATGEGTLSFNTKQGNRIWVSGTELAEELCDQSSLRLVFLNACRTAQAGAMAPYAGVATALLSVGIPVVVAMQFPISDPAALALSRAFYRRIARGDTVGRRGDRGAEGDPSLGGGQHRVGHARSLRTSAEWPHRQAGKRLAEVGHLACWESRFHWAPAGR
jgi:CHAT domain-containing protein